MKNLLTALLPALALLALGGCAGTSALTSSEDDGVYYSSKDHTTAVMRTPPAPAPASTDEAANPDYHGNTGSSSARQGSGSDQYYDNTYTYMKGVPGYSPGSGLSYYTPYSPYTTLSPYGYSWGVGACGFSPYAYGFYDPFYCPIYSPFGYGYGYGSGLSITFGLGFGRSWGYGGYGGYYGYGRPYGYGSFYDPFYYSSPFYGGYYGRGGYYGGSYYGGNYGYSNGYYDNGRSTRPSAHRTDRSSDGRYSSGGGMGSTGGTTSAPVGSGRVRDELRPQGSPVSAPNSGVSMGEAGRTRTEAMPGAPATGAVTAPSGTEAGGFNSPRRIEQRADQPIYRNMDQRPMGAGQPPLDSNPTQGQITRDDNRSRGRNPEAMPQNGDQLQPAATPQEGGRRRGGFFQSMPAQPGNADGGQAADQAQQRRAYDQARQRSYEQPQQQRTYEQPQQRTYEQPQRTYSQPSYSQPSYSAPSNGGGGGGGGGGRGRGRGE